MRLVVLDIETTGLDFDRDCVLEVCAASGRMDEGFFVEDERFQATWKPHPNFIGADDVWCKQWGDFARETHRPNGLFADMVNGVDTLEFVRLIQEFFLRASSEEKPFLVGRNVASFDKRFLERGVGKLPVQYRALDLSSLESFFSLAGVEFRKAKSSNHRAVDDVNEAISQLEWSWRAVRLIEQARLPGPMLGGRFA